MLIMNAGFETLPADYQAVVREAQAQHRIQITPLQELKGGQTGARLYLVSAAQDGAAQVQHMIMKLDRVNPKARASEMDLHEQALRLSPPGFARTHIPGFPFTPVKNGEATGIFYAIAGQSLQNYRAFGSFGQSKQLETLFSATNNLLLGEWNAGAGFPRAAHPQSLLTTWLGYRLKPGGAIERFFSDTLRISPDAAGLAVEGKVYPNPLYYARNPDAWGKARPIDALVGLQHGDLNTGNILARFAPGGRKLDGYYLIDFSLFKEAAPLLYDHAYLILSYLLLELERTPFDRWVKLAVEVGEQDLPDPARAPVESAGACGAIRAGRAAFAEWVNERHPSLADDLWAQYRLAAAAAGLNFCNKPLSERERLGGLIYAAAHLGVVLERFGAPPPGDIAPLPLGGQSGRAQRAVESLALDAGQAAQNCLPAAATPFIGRGEELDAVTRGLLDEQTRLLTLTGPGGTGKTRLAIAAAEALLARFEHGVCYVPLENVRDPGMVLATIGLRLGLRETSGQPLEENLRVHLRDRQLLLVIDNFEQVVAAAPAVSLLLSLGRRVKVMVTSRVALNLSAEREYAVPPMRLPDPARGADWTEISQTEAVQLFTQRAQAAQGSFTIHAENAAAVAELCRQLDGLPLAIELAAARVRLLPPQAMLKRLSARLGQRLSLLTGGARDLPARQQTLRQTIEWSYTLLSEPEKTLFTRLAVFAGGWTLEAAEAVCSADGDLEDVLTLLEALINSSLAREVSAAAPGGDETGPRFSMLETIREYALEQLAERGETARLAALHAQHYARETADIGLRMFSREAPRHLAWVGAEQDNLRAALAWSLEPGNEIGAAVPIVSVAFWYWYRRGQVHEGREWCRRIIEKLDNRRPTPEMARMLIFAGSLAMWEGDLKPSTESFEACIQMAQYVEDELTLAFGYMGSGVNLLNRGDGARALDSLHNALALFREIQFDFYIANTLIHLANATLALGDPDGARAYLEQALPVAEQVGEEWLIASILNNLGEVARTQRDYPRAQAHYEQSEALFRKLGDVEDHNRLVHSLGYIALYQGDLDTAERRFRDSLRVYREVSNRRGVAECLAGLARLAFLRGRAALAARLLAAATAAIHAWGADWWPADQVEQRHNLADLRAALPAENFETAWKAGQGLTVEQALALEAGQA